MRVIPSFLLLSLLLTIKATFGQIRQQKLVKDTIEHIVLDTLQVSAPAGITPYQPSAPKVWNIKHTRIALSFNMTEKTAQVEEWIHMQPYCYATDSVELDAKSILFNKVELLKGTTNTALAFTYQNNQLKVTLPTRYSINDSLVLHLVYVSQPYAVATGGSTAITDDRGLYFINTDYKTPHKPAEIWTQGETESNSHWMVTVDKPNTRFTTQIELTVPDSFTTLSNGALIKSSKAAKGLRTDLWRMDQPIQAYAAMFAIGKFSITRSKWRNKEVNYYVEPEYAAYAGLMFRYTPEMLEFFSKCTGVPYPWNKYSQVVVRDYVSGAMENTSASLFGEFVNQTAREIADKNSEDVVSHELFHQWFGDYVTCESWSNITVNESFANYGEQLWRRHFHGKANADELAWDDLQKYLTRSILNDPQLVRFRYDNREVVFDAISYNKGGAILHYLNTLIGDTAFNKSMQLYLTANAMHSAEAHNWRMAVEEATGQDWNWFFDQWYYHAGHPELDVNYAYDDSAGLCRVTVTQTQDDSPFVYRLPLKALVINRNQAYITDWDLRKKETHFEYTYKNGTRPVIVPDCEHVLPGKIKENKSAPEWLAQYQHCSHYVSRKLAVAGAISEIGTKDAQALIDAALRDTLGSIRRYTLEQLTRKKGDKYHEMWTDRIIELAKRDSDNKVRAAALDVLGEWKVLRTQAMLTMAVADSSYLVSGSALEALSTLDQDSAYQVAFRLLPSHPRAAQKTAIWSIFGKAAKDSDIVLFEHDVPFEQGTGKGLLASTLGSYLKHVKSDSSFKRGVTLLQHMITSEHMRNYKTSFAGYLAMTGYEQRDDLTSETKEKTERAKYRMDLVGAAFDAIVTGEQDPANVERFRKMIKDSLSK